MALRVYDKLKHAIRYWLLRRLPTCQQTVETISQSMERKLPAEERIKMTVHLWICAWCQWYLEHLHIIRDAARTHAAESDTGSQSVLSLEARERIKQALTRR